MRESGLTARRMIRWIGVAAGLLLLALLLWHALVLWRAHQRTPEVLVRAASGELELADLSPERRRWILMVEDPNFLDHGGMDVSAIGQGNTNITQSLVKTFYFKRFKPGFAKIEQVLIAGLVLDPALSKDGQLKAYLNHAYLGQDGPRPIVGYADAARTWFGKPFGQLSEREFLSILAVTIAPNQLSPVRNKAAHADRLRRVERLVAGQCAPADRSDVSYRNC